MSNLAHRVPGLATFTVMALLSTCTFAVFYKYQQETTKKLVTAQEERSTKEQVHLAQEGHRLELEVINLKHALAVAETTLATQTRISQIHEQRVENYAGAQESSAQLIKAGKEHVQKLESVVGAGKDRIAALEEELKVLRSETARKDLRLLALELRVQELRAENEQLKDAEYVLPAYHT